jgi:hypothetical protein
MVRGSHNLQGQEIASMNKGGKCVRSNNQGSLNLQRTRNCSYEQRRKMRMTEAIIRGASTCKGQEIVVMNKGGKSV